MIHNTLKSFKYATHTKVVQGIHNNVKGAKPLDVETRVGDNVGMIRKNVDRGLKCAHGSATCDSRDV